MNKDVYYPIIVFLAASLLSVIFFPMLIGSIVAGVTILLFSFSNKGPVALSKKLMVRSGLALVIGPVFTFGAVWLGMSGFFHA